MMNKIEVLHKLAMEEKLKFAQDKIKSLDSMRLSLQDMCANHEDYKDMFKTRIRKLEFQSMKYQDKQSYDSCMKMKKMYNMFEYLMKHCD